MGTNYYLITAECPCCHRHGDRIHIGKSSAGWCFALRVDEDAAIRGLSDWEARWSAPGATIVNEYGDAISPADMLATIASRSWKAETWTDAALAYNGAVKGPAGLARSPIDGYHCVGHGEGTYDLMRGEFS